jgi:hypothetical protein
MPSILFVAECGSGAIILFSELSECGNFWGGERANGESGRPFVETKKLVYRVFLQKGSFSTRNNYYSSVPQPHSSLPGKKYGNTTLEDYDDVTFT